jgi:hypothetical protein
MFRQPANDALGVDRHAFEVETLDNIQLLAAAFSPGTRAVFDAQKICAQNRLNHVFSKQPVFRTFQIGFQRKFVVPVGHEPFNFDQPMVHARSLRSRPCGNN